jgi:nucleotide-binding universal stress UspA family protein/nitrite reductase/ring-hydroxylating ferredoxin subunit
MGYRSIVVGTDGSDTAALAVRSATGLAKRFGAAVQIVCAHGDGLDESTAAEILRHAEEAVRAAEVESEVHVRRGAAAEVLKGVAQAQGGEMIVVGNVGMGKAKRFKLGGIAERVAHEAPCDVLIVHTRDLEAPEAEYRHLLVGTDGSATATEAARKGFELAEILDAEVTLVHVGDPFVGAVVLEETTKSRPGSAPVHTEAVSGGDPGERLVDRAGRGDVDLLVVGNKGMSGPRRYLLGSVPSRVMHESPIDVMIAKTVGRTAKDLAPGHGGLVDAGGRRLAVYKADDGSLITLSPRCQHMGCTVDWNDADRTWDCPCHGSRYRFDGAVIKGPAKKDLDKVDASPT